MVVAEDVVVKRSAGLRQTDCVGTLKCFVLDIGLFDYSLETQHEHIYYLTFILELSSDLTERITQNSRADSLEADVALCYPRNHNTSHIEHNTNRG